MPPVVSPDRPRLVPFAAQLDQLMATSSADRNVRPGLMEGLREVALFFDEGNKAGCFVSPAGSGKSRLISLLAKAVGGRALIVAGDRLSVPQLQDEFREQMPNADYGVFYSNEKRAGRDGLITSYTSWVNRVKDGVLKPEHFDIAILDEGHLALGELRSKVTKQFRDAGVPILAVTATPSYNEERSIESLIGPIIYRLRIRDAIDAKLIAPYHNVICETDIDFGSVPIIGGEYRRDLQEAVLMKSRIDEIGLEILRSGFRDARGFVSCSGTAHADSKAALLRRDNFKALAVHSNLRSGEPSPEEALAMWKRGEVHWLTFDKMLSASVDLPEAAVCMNLRQTFSPVFKEQTNGRCQRLDPGNPDKTFYPVCIMGRDYRRGGALTYTDIVDGISIYGGSKGDLALSRPLRVKASESTVREYGGVIHADSKSVEQFLIKRRELSMPDIPSDWMTAQEIGASVGVSSRLVRIEIDKRREEFGESVAVGTRPGGRKAEYSSPAVAGTIMRHFDPLVLEAANFHESIEDPDIAADLMAEEARSRTLTLESSEIRADTLRAFKSRVTSLASTVKKRPLALLVMREGAEYSGNLTNELDRELRDQQKREREVSRKLIDLYERDGALLPDPPSDRAIREISESASFLRRSRPHSDLHRSLVPWLCAVERALPKAIREDFIGTVADEAREADRSLIENSLKSVWTDLSKIMEGNAVILARVAALRAERLGGSLSYNLETVRERFEQNLMTFNGSDQSVSRFLLSLFGAELTRERDETTDAQEFPDVGEPLVSVSNPNTDDRVMRAIQLLPARDAMILDHLFGLTGPELDTREVAKKFGVSSGWINARKIAAIRALRRGEPHKIIVGEEDDDPITAEIRARIRGSSR